MSVFNWMFGKQRGKPSSAWKTGDRVLARWQDSFFYPGRVEAVADDSCQVRFDDGDLDWVQNAHIRNPDVRVGSRVFARVQGGPFFAPAVVAEKKGETIQVRYDHGDEEWTSLSMLRLQPDSPAPLGSRDLPESEPAAPVRPGIDVGDPVLEGTWRVGDRVLARWLDLFWYPGTILAMGTKGFHILYDDGDQRVVREAVLMPLLLEEGERIQIRPKMQPERIYSPAVVTRVDGEVLDVDYEDGERETNTRVTRARLWRCPTRIRAFPFEEGDRVLAGDIDDHTYPAEILSVEDDRVIVQFLDGPERMLTPELIRRFDLRAGSRVECRWKGGPAYFPGVINKTEGDRVLIDYDDGDQEWTTIRLVRVQPVT